MSDTNEIDGLLRRGVVLWEHAENGAPFIGGYVRSGDALKVASDPEDSNMALTMGSEYPMATRMAKALSKKLRSTRLPPGNYRYQNPIFANRSRGLDMLPVSDIAEEDYKVYERKQVEFMLTTEHIQLLRHANIYRTAPGIDAKRPYGSRSAMHLDIADILGIRYDDSDELYNRLESLHQQNQIALQVLLIFG